MDVLGRLRELALRPARTSDDRAEMAYLAQILQSAKVAQRSDEEDGRLGGLAHARQMAAAEPGIQEVYAKAYKYDQLVNFITLQDAGLVQRLLSRIILEPQGAEVPYQQLFQAGIQDTTPRQHDPDTSAFRKALAEVQLLGEAAAGIIPPISARMSEISARITATEKMVQQLGLNMANTAAKIDEKDRCIEGLQEKLGDRLVQKEQTDQVLKLQQRLQEGSDYTKTIQGELEKKHAETEEMRREIEQINSHADSLQRELKKKDVIIAQLREQHGGSTTTKAGLASGELDVLRDQVREIRAQINKTRQQCQLLTISTQRQVDSKVTQLQGTLTNMMHQYDSLHYESSTVQQLKTELTLKTNELDNLNLELCRLKDQLGDDTDLVSFYTALPAKPLFNDVFMNKQQLDSTRISVVKQLKLAKLLQRDASHQVLRVIGHVNQFFQQDSVGEDFKLHQLLAVQDRQKRTTLFKNYVRYNFTTAMQCYIDFKIEALVTECQGCFPLMDEQNQQLYVSLIGIIFYLIIDGWEVGDGVRVQAGKTIVFPLMQRKRPSGTSEVLNALQTLDTELVD